MGSKLCMKPPESWSSQLRILFGWGKKGSGLTRLVGQVRFPSRILFFLWKKKVLTPHKFYRSAINRGVRRLWTFSERYCDTADPFCREQKKDSDASGIHKTTKNTPAFGTRVPEGRFAFCVVNVLRYGYMDIWKHRYRIYVDMDMGSSYLWHDHMESTSTDQLGPLGAISMAKVLKSSHQQCWENSAMFDRSKDNPESIDRVITTYPLTANLWP